MPRVSFLMDDTTKTRRMMATRMAISIMAILAVGDVLDSGDKQGGFLALPAPLAQAAAPRIPLPTTESKPSLKAAFVVNKTSRFNHLLAKLAASGIVGGVSGASGTNETDSNLNLIIAVVPDGIAAFGGGDDGRPTVAA